MDFGTSPQRIDSPALAVAGGEFAGNEADSEKSLKIGLEKFLKVAFFCESVLYDLCNGFILAKAVKWHDWLPNPLLCGFEYNTIIIQ